MPRANLETLINITCIFLNCGNFWKLEESQQAETCQLHRQEPGRGMEPRTFLLRGDWHSQHVNKAYSSCWPCRFHSQSFRALPANPASGGIRHWRISNSNIVTQYRPRNVLLGFIIILWNVNIYPKDNQRKSTFSKEQFYTGACTILQLLNITSGTLRGRIFLFLSEHLNWLSMCFWSQTNCCSTQVFTAGRIWSVRTCEPLS